MPNMPTIHLGNRVEFASTAGLPQSHWELAEVVKVKINSIDVYSLTRRAVFMDVRHIDDPTVHDPKAQVRSDSGVFKLTHEDLQMRKALVDIDLLRREMQAMREAFAAISADASQSSNESVGTGRRALRTASN